jgi:type II secretion system protein N
MSATVKRLLYTLYIVTITVVFLYFLFPSETVKRYVSAEISRSIPELTVAIDHVKPSFPPGILLNRVGLRLQDQTLFDFDRIKIRPVLSSLIGSKTSWSFDARAYSGEVRGRADVTAGTPQRQVTVDAELKNIQIRNIEAIKRLPAHTVSGLLFGTVSYQQSPPAPRLKGNLGLTDLRVDLSNPTFGVDAVEFDRVQTELQLDNRALTIRQCELKGKQLDASLTGNVSMLDRPGSQSLNIRGRFQPHPLFLAQIENSLATNFLRQRKSDKGGFSFRISGSLDNPRFSLN